MKGGLGKRVAQLALIAIIGTLAILWLGTWPPNIPSYATVRASWQPSESWLYDRHGRLIDSVRVDFSRRRLSWVPLSAIAPTLRHDVVTAEDRRFATHDGVDWLAMLGALHDRWEGRHARGASTITMQLAGFLAGDLAAPGKRKLWDKMRQMRAAMAIERSWTKDQILEAYLNLAGYRGEAQGIMAASQSLYGKSPAGLSPKEAAIVTALLPDPQAAPSVIARRACRLVETDCTALKVQLAAALGPARAIATDPGLAPHLATRLLQKPGVKVTTTLDASIQRIAIAALRRQLIGLGDQRARDGAVVVLDNRSGDVLAYVGGVGGGSTAAAVDGADSYRQAGSTLKPFLYAMAIERGFLTPASILDDSPVQLDTASGLYVPQNYDRGFKGPVSVRSALAGSLNVPAVRTLLLVGVDAFRDRLSDLDYEGLTEDGDYYGFSLALGSAEVTLLEQANAYRALANGGRWSPLRLSAGDPSGPSRQTMSPAAAWIVSDMMADPGARARTFGLDSALRLPFWAAVKTGTSKAMRDNWCIGFSDRYTVGVWIGNLEGDSMRAVSGTSGAAPVWRELMLALHQGRPGSAPPRPHGIDVRNIVFAGGIEPPRREYFLAGTGQSSFAEKPSSAERPRIVAPVSGSIYALDPDIPLSRQRIRVSVAGASAGDQLLVDNHALGPAEEAPLLLPTPGAHLISVIDAQGQTVDRVRFVVR